MGCSNVIGRLVVSLLTLAAVGCSGSGDADGEPTYTAGAGSTASMAGSAGSAGTQSQAGAGGTNATPAASDECEIRGDYRLIGVLTAGGAACSPGVEVEDAQVQSKDIEACTLTARVDGVQFIRDMVCERGNPVVECTVTVESGACTYVWTMTRE